MATGTFLNGLIHTGRRTYSAGAGEPAIDGTSGQLKRLGFTVGRLKTGTPPRLDGRTIDGVLSNHKPPDRNPVAFSFSTESIEQQQIDCHIGYTTDALHQTIRETFTNPLSIRENQRIGPRYCPSIEDKVVKLPIRIAINYFWSRKVTIRTRFTSMAFRRLFPRSYNLSWCE